MDDKNLYMDSKLRFSSREGRVLSSSYIPLAHEPVFDEMMRELKGLLKKYEQEGLIKLEYNTVIHYGQLL